jgi:hypothetical protein
MADNQDNPGIRVPPPLSTCRANWPRTHWFAKAGNLDYSAFHDDSSLPVIISSFSISVL